MIHVCYVDVGTPLIPGVKIKVIPYNHPDRVSNDRWVNAGKVLRVWDELNGPGFTTEDPVHGITHWIPLEGDPELMPVLPKIKQALMTFQPTEVV